jgi:hypothetical protein
VASGVRAFLVTAEIGLRMDMWAAVASFTNWVDGRGPVTRETWQVMCPGNYAEGFLDIARTLGVTVEGIEGSGDDERYVMLVGEPGSGWGPVTGTGVGNG